MPRLFIAIEVPGQIRDAIARVQSELRSAINPRAVTWTRPEQFHLTLKFLGEVRQDDIMPLGLVLKNISASFQPFALRTVGVGFFPTPDRPRILWAAVKDEQGDERLLQLHRAIEAAAAPFTVEKPQNRFHAHITMGRAKELFRSDMAHVLRWGNDHAGAAFGEWHAENFVLVQSRLSDEGATHSVLARFSFSSQEPVRNPSGSPLQAR